MDRDRERANSFGVVAETYERYRPDYPAAAIEWVLEVAPGRRVLDLGAGTGKLSRAAVAAGAVVTAVEPSEQMLAQLRLAVPEATAISGAAEDIPVADGSVDAVVVGQAFHWFDPEPALAEIHRVLVPGGVVGLVWNIRDDSVEWVAELMALDGGGDRISLENEQPWEALALDTGFGSIDREYFPNPIEFSAERLRGFVASTSRVSTKPEAERDKVLEQVDRLAGEHPDLAGRPSFTMPYVTEVVRAVRTA
jgi:SAM-dependent methyltransferase